MAVTEVDSGTQVFQTGPYGEILPPPLVGSLSPDEALDQLVKDAQTTGQPIVSVPKRGKSRAGMYNLAMLYVHQANLAGAIAGRLDDPDALALRQAVVEDGRPLSLRPLGMESLWLTTFAPVLQLVDPQTGTWRAGLPGRGRVTTFQAEADTALKQAQQVYVAWCTEEDQQWQGWLSQAAREIKPYYQHLVWQAALTISEELLAEVAEGYALQRLGKHTTYRLLTPAGERVFEASSPLRAVVLATAILQRQKAALPHYRPDQVIEALVKLGGRRPVQGPNGVWYIGAVRAKFLPNNVIGLAAGEKRFGLSNHKNLFTLGQIGQSNTVTKTVGRLLVPAVWTGAEKIRVGLTWAAWSMGRVVR